MRTKFKGRFSLLFLALAMLLAIPAAALADVVKNDIVADTGNNQQEKNYTIGGDPAKVGYYIHPTGGSCDAADGTSATVSINVPVDSGITATPSNLTFSNCTDANKQFVGFSGTKEGKYQITISVSDTSGTYNQKEATFFLTVGKAPEPAAPSDTTPPVITKVVTGTEGSNDWYTSNVSVDWTVNDPESGISSQSGCADFSVTSDQNPTTPYTCSATSGGGTSSDSVTIKRDATKPTPVAGAPGRDPDHNGWYNKAVNIVFSGQDATSGIASCSTVPYDLPDGTGLTTNGSCTDNAGNESDPVASSAFKYDATKPTNIAFSGISDNASFDYGDVPAQSGLGCSADDATSGPPSCSISGYSAAVGNHTLTATATDQAGNSDTKTLSYSVLAWKLSGFYSPVDMGGVVNTVKNGSTVPLKFEVFKSKSGQELTDTAIVNQPLTAKQVSCTGGTEDTVELTASGSTSLRYDATAGQFIYNWQTPKKPGYCYSVSVATQDGSSIPVAYFKLK